MINNILHVIAHLLISDIIPYKTLVIDIIIYPQTFANKCAYNSIAWLIISITQLILPCHIMANVYILVTLPIVRGMIKSPVDGITLKRVLKSLPYMNRVCKILGWYAILTLLSGVYSMPVLSHTICIMAIVSKRRILNALLVYCMTWKLGLNVWVMIFAELNN